jgi:hypothetical protein
MTFLPSSHLIVRGSPQMPDMLLPGASKAGNQLEKRLESVLFQATNKTKK